MKRKELEIIKQAIINEIEGYEFYKLAARDADNQDSKEAFLTLAGEELEHVKYLKGLFSTIRDSEKDDFDLAWTIEAPSPKIFDWEKIKIKPGSLSMSVFSVGIEMEKASVAFYEKAKTNTNYSAASKLYSVLIDWEKAHLDQFVEEYNRLREDWWSEQSFEPF